MLSEQERKDFSALKQGDIEWLYARIGRVTASRIPDVINYLKNGKEGSDRRNYRTFMVSEMLTGHPIQNTYVSQEMERGIEKEGDARLIYNFRTTETVKQVGLIVHPVHDLLASSPDALVGNDGGLEIKCPKTETHINYLLGDVVPEDYQPQMQFNMACTGRKWWDFMSFDDRLPPRYQVFIKRLERDENKILDAIEAAAKFMLEVANTIVKLQECCPALPEQPVKVDRYEHESDDLAEDVRAVEAENKARSKAKEMDYEELCAFAHKLSGGLLREHFITEQEYAELQTKL